MFRFQDQYFVIYETRIGLFDWVTLSGSLLITGLKIIFILCFDVLPHDPYLSRDGMTLFLQTLLGPLLGPFSAIFFSTFANQNVYYIPAHIRQKLEKTKNMTSKQTNIGLNPFPDTLRAEV